MSFRLFAFTSHFSIRPKRRALAILVTVAVALTVCYVVASRWL